jgi:hypothetical protein
LASTASLLGFKNCATWRREQLPKESEHRYRAPGPLELGAFSTDIRSKGFGTMFVERAVR